MNVLIACEESQRVCTAFRNKGHTAFSCDLKPCTGGHPEWHIMCDALQILSGGVSFATMDGTPHHIAGKWDLVIAHPPCTYLSNSGAARLYQEPGEIDKDRYINGLDGKALFMAFYWYGRFGGVIAIENPTPSAVYELPKETQVIQPYQFGHPYSKRTLLWLFGLPDLKPTKVVVPLMSWVSGGSKDAKGNPRKNKGETFRDSKTKSLTFQGIAEAMAEQWTEETIGKTGEQQISFL